jgi:hypothetical protein
LTGPIAITPNGKTAYAVTAPGSAAPSDAVTPINTATNKPGKAIKVGGNLVKIAITLNGKTVYAVNDNQVKVLEVQAHATQVLGSPDPEGLGDCPAPLRIPERAGHRLGMARLPGVLHLACERFDPSRLLTDPLRQGIGPSADVLHDRAGLTADDLDEGALHHVEQGAEENRRSKLEKNRRPDSLPVPGNARGDGQPRQRQADQADGNDEQPSDGLSLSWIRGWIGHDLTVPAAQVRMVRSYGGRPGYPASTVAVLAGCREPLVPLHGRA